MARRKTGRVPRPERAPKAPTAASKKARAARSVTRDPVTPARPAGATARGTAGKKAGPRAFRLDPDRLAAARRVLGTPNDTATIDAALDYVVFGRELRAGAEALAGIHFDAFDREGEGRGDEAAS
ncbi:MAG TPA: hypothetical protein VFS00_21645 [Polyangiaceae bacterium]|nr:hypothetical protein [Polyangiaceae bacterium]